jgi:hypothetical protein
MRAALAQPKRTETDRPWTRVDLLAVLSVCAAVAVATRTFWAPGIANTWDMLMGIYRSYALDQAWQAGVLYPRLFMPWTFTYGAPLFEFYAPAVSYLGLFFHFLGFGWVEASKATFGASLLLAGLGTYVYARWVFGHRRAAFLAALVYALSPYLLISMYERGAAAECLALGLLPWTFWAAHHVQRGAGHDWVWVTAAMVALITLSHNITALFVLPILGVYLLFVSWREHDTSGLPRLGLAVALGLTLSAFFWAPALVERPATQLESRMTSSYQLYEHLVQPATLVQLQLAFEYWGPFSRHLSLWQASLGVLALGVLVWRQGWRGRDGLPFLALVALAIPVLQLQFTFPLWERVPLVRFIQFPWRLFGLLSFCIALLIGAVFTLPRARGKLGWLLLLAVLAIIGFGSLANLQKLPGRYPVSSGDISAANLNEQARWGYGLFIDYLPAWVSVEPQFLAVPRPGGSTEPASPGPAPHLRVSEERLGQLSLQVEAVAPFTLRLHRFYYPGWQAVAAGASIPVRPSGPMGLVTVSLPAGSYPLVLRFGETPLRLVLDILALTALIVTVLAMSRRRRTRLALLGMGVFLVLLVGLGLCNASFTQRVQRPAPVGANFEDQVLLLAYHLPKKTWHAGDTLPLRLYWYAHRGPTQDLKVFVHVVRPPDGDKVAQHDSEPIQSYSPTTRWEPGEIVVDEHLVHLPPDAPSGVYDLLVGLYRQEPVQNLRASGAGQILPGDRVVLAEIAIIE